jgi:hypothetical protein
MSPLARIAGFLPNARALLAGTAAVLIAMPAMAQNAPRPAASNQRCATPAERSALDIRALQSQLMVVAITCAKHDDYNRFVTQNRTVLGAAYNDVQRHFRRLHGGGGQRELDAYITNTANGHSQVGISQGSLFCTNQAPLFPAALAANGRDALAGLSRERQIAQVYTPDACPAARPAARPAGQQSTQPQRSQQQAPRSQQPTRTAQANPR